MDDFPYYTPVVGLGSENCRKRQASQSGNLRQRSRHATRDNENQTNSLTLCTQSPVSPHLGAHASSLQQSFSAHHTSQVPSEANRGRIPTRGRGRRQVAAGAQSPVVPHSGAHASALQQRSAAQYTAQAPSAARRGRIPSRGRGRQRVPEFLCNFLGGEAS